VSLTTPEKVA
jgi:hypothetical protein